jgi:glutamine synthetase
MTAPLIRPAAKLPTSVEELAHWIAREGVAEVECIVPDMNGVIRGKVVPAPKFLRMVEDTSLRIPSSLFSVTVTGDYPDDISTIPITDPDMVLVPDLSTIRVASGYKTPTAYVITDARHADGAPVEVAPREVLKRVLRLYAEHGWRPVVAPELEFFLTAMNADPDLPLQTPLGRSGRAESSPEPYGLEAVNEFEDLIEEIYDFAERARLDIDTLIHESGAGQLEINFQHGDALELSDQVLLAKRIIRQVAQRHGVHATFMAKPMQNQPGSAMHIHQSVVDDAGANIFAHPDGSDSALFQCFIGGLQRLLPQIAPLFAPNVNSFRRMKPAHDAPINVQWGVDNRTCGLRVPRSAAKDRRVENRLPGADANPYLAVAASLLAGYIGIVELIEPRESIEGSAYRLQRTMPRSLTEALDRFERCRAVRPFLGEAFIETFIAIKNAELEAYQEVISSWEREHLLLKV